MDKSNEFDEKIKAIFAIKIDNGIANFMALNGALKWRKPEAETA